MTIKNENVSYMHIHGSYECMILYIFNNNISYVDDIKISYANMIAKSTRKLG